MEIFGIGILEVLAVGLLMAIIFGPNRLPEIAKQGGRAVRELREYARDFRDEYLTDFEEIREEYLEVRHELKESDAEFRQEMRELDADLRSVVKDAEEDATEAMKEAEKAVKGAEGVATGTGDTKSTEGTSGAAAVATAPQPDGADAADAKAPSPTSRDELTAAKTDPPRTRRAGAEKRERRVPRGRRRGGSDGDAPARPGKVISINRRKSSE